MDSYKIIVLLATIFLFAEGTIIYKPQEKALMVWDLATYKNYETLKVIYAKRKAEGLIDFDLAPISSLYRWKSKFLEDGNFNDGRGKVNCTIEQTKVDAIKALTKNGTFPTSVRLIAAHPTVNLTRYMAHKVLRYCLKLKPYHPRNLQSLMDKQQDRLDFARLVSVDYGDDPDAYFKQIIYTDESWFSTEGPVNKHNTIFCAESNPYHIYDKQMRPNKTMVIAFIGYEYRNGPYFFNGTVTGASYRAMLQNHLFSDPYIKEGFAKKKLIFMQDGAGPHTSIENRAFLNEMTGGRWMGKYSPYIWWPPYSPDLTPMDFFLWPMLKKEVYQHGRVFGKELELLKQNITVEFKKIPQFFINKACVKEIKERLEEVIKKNGSHIAHDRENRRTDPADYLYLDPLESVRLGLDTILLADDPVDQLECEDDDLDYLQFSNATANEEPINATAEVLPGCPNMSHEVLFLRALLEPSLAAKLDSVLYSKQCNSTE